VAQFYLSRSVGFHLVQSYLPTMLIVVISWVSFWMDVDSVPGRTTLGVTTLLAVGSQSSGTSRYTIDRTILWFYCWNIDYLIPISNFSFVNLFDVLCVFSTGIQSGLPQVSYVKAIDVWMGTCTGMVQYNLTVCKHSCHLCTSII